MKQKITVTLEFVDDDCLFLIIDRVYKREEDGVDERDSFALNRDELLPIRTAISEYIKKGFK